MFRTAPFTDNEGKRKNTDRHTVYSPTVGSFFQSTGQVVTCWKGTQNIGNILPLQPPSPPYSTYRGAYCILLHLCSLHCLSFTTSLSVYYPHSISLYLLLSFFHISLVVFIPTRPYMESGFICRLKQCWSASYRLEQTLTNADDYSEALMVDIGNTLHNIGSESLLLHIWLKRENELYLAWNVPHPDLWKCWLNTVLLSHDCYFRVF